MRTETRCSRRHTWYFTILLCGALVPMAVAQVAPPNATVSALSGEPVLYQMTDADLGVFIADSKTKGLTPAERVAYFAQATVGQPYRAAASMFDHREGDCVTFVEHAIAMSLATSLDSYYRLVLRLRYANGNLPVAAGALEVAGYRLRSTNGTEDKFLLLNRNHFTLAQWVPNNSWCLVDITKDLIGTDTVKPWIPFNHVARPRELFLKNGLDIEQSELRMTDAFIPWESLEAVLPEVHSGDIALVIRGEWPNFYCDHMGVIYCPEYVPEKSFASNTLLVHAVPPRARQEPLSRLIHRCPWIEGFKFLRLTSEAEQSAAREDGGMVSRSPAMPVR